MGTVIVPLILFDIWHRIVNICIQKKKIWCYLCCHYNNWKALLVLQVQIDFQERSHVSWAQGFDCEPSRQILYMHCELRKWHWLNLKELAMAPAMEVSLRVFLCFFLVPVRFCQVLLNRLFSSIVTIILPHSVTFVEKGKCHGSILSKQLHEKCR